MIPTPVEFAFLVSWVATGLGVGMWIWSWLRAQGPISKLRFRDCGVVLVLCAVMTRIVIQTRELTAIDWAILLLGPLFIAACLWRLTRTQDLKS